MRFINDGLIAEEIFVPESLLTSVPLKDGWGQEASRRSSRYHQHNNQVEEIHVPKKRQPTTRKAPDGFYKVGTGRHRPTSTPAAKGEPDERIPIILDGEGQSGIESLGDRNTSLRPHWRKSIQHEQPGEVHRDFEDSNSRTLPNNGTHLSHLPVHQPSSTATKPRKSSLMSLYDRTSLVNIKHQRKYWLRLLIEYGAYTALAAFAYLVLIGTPLWKGAVCWLYWLMQRRFVFSGGWAIAIALLVFYSFTPLLRTFENDALGPDYYQQRRIIPEATDTALLIPCYRSGPIIGQTLKAALKVFPASHVYVIANGNSSTPLDNTEEICRANGVNHIWCPVGSKIVALFIGCYAAKNFRYTLLIDDDCILPANFPVVVSRLTDSVRCIGYPIKSVNTDPSKSSYCQQAQDLEYKLAGLQRSFAGHIGSATFPHGAVSLWERSFLKEVFQHHPGFNISEDWFLGNSCRRLGGRIQMCTAVFVETTTPSALLFAKRSHGRGGFGEMTVFKQRFLRWGFFTTNGMWHNLSYLLGSWKLGKWEAGTKLFVFQEVYETVLYLLFPFILPVSLLVRPGFCIIMLAATLGLYMLNTIIFNEVHLRLKNERVRWEVLWYHRELDTLQSVRCPYERHQLLLVAIQICPVFRKATP
ncbi:glycosyltransferase like family 2-domain-containing protein [Penicillium angulare]|uniref:glycosyltransferase like family 2-domain-containing protein n=1 Tax=Penicillium angulare TaxID=116970 RepID=UPI002541110F|nr:glycosyltransferase like family 2-domain-containing protein [Penicillium angulare]KAJ5288124.1 glycosyltransferase like family 2-domain-containing protein [Penicillium angulare]